MRACLSCTIKFIFAETCCFTPDIPLCFRPLIHWLHDSIPAGLWLFSLDGGTSYARDGSSVTLRGNTLYDNTVTRGSVIIMVASQLRTIEVTLAYKLIIAKCVQSVQGV